jgi:hypothetical protein
MTNLEKKQNPLESLKAFLVTKERVENMVATKMIWHNIIASGHLSVWIAQANGGKTTIAKQACVDLVQDGFNVFYFQEDAGAGDLPLFLEHAEMHGYSLLNSTLANSSPSELLQILEKLVQEDADLSNYVFFFDTLKKFLDVMAKKGARDFYMLMRALTIKGATVVLLGHTTKRPDKDGKQIFDGVGDTRNDVDELIYIESTIKDVNGHITFTMKPDKWRCIVNEISFKYDSSSNALTQLDESIDASRIRNSQDQLSKDDYIINLILESLGNDALPITALVHKVRKNKECRYGDKYIKGVIERYADTNPEKIVTKWYESRERQNNTRLIYAIPF